MRQQFRGRSYKVVTSTKIKPPDFGECSSPHKPGRIIRLRPDLSPARLMEAGLHEGLHACLWDLDEEAVAEAAANLRDFLWRLGFRLDPSEAATLSADDGKRGNQWGGRTRAGTQGASGKSRKRHRSSSRK